MGLKRRLAGWLSRSKLLRWSLRLAIRIVIPRHYVGAVGVVFNDAGQILLVEHVFRPYFNWGLPGGWVEAGEDPADAVRRELEEELGVSIEVGRLLLCEPQGNDPRENAPRGLGLAYYGRLTGGQQVTNSSQRGSAAYEILSVEWVDPGNIEYELTTLEKKAIPLAQAEFAREQKTSQTLPE